MLFRALNDPRRGFDHGDLIEICGRSVRLRVHAGARRISLRLDPRDQIIVATAPDRRRLKEAVAFAESRAEWIETQLRKLPVAVSFAPGLMITVEGAPCRLERAAMRISPILKPATGDEPARLLAYGTDEAYSRAVVRCLKATAAQRLEARTRVHATALGRPMPNVFVTDAKARWGSCRQAHAGVSAQIRYNWRLILSPPWVLDYVVAHECAHLIEANHGPNFWALSHQLHPNVREARDWLKRHGAELHAAGQ